MSIMMWFGKVHWVTNVDKKLGTKRANGTVVLKKKLCNIAYQILDQCRGHGQRGVQK